MINLFIDVSPFPRLSGSQPAYRGIGMNGLVATWYARNAARNIGDYERDARRIANLVPSGSRVLEIAPGPGFQAIQLANLGDFKIRAIDISETFVEIARRNAKSAGVNVEFELGNASALPIHDGSIDLVYCRAAFKNFSEPLKAIQEMHRVLRPGGRAVIQDLRPDASERAIDEQVARMNMGRINAALTRWIFKRMLVGRAHPRQRIEEMASRATFAHCEVSEEPLGYYIVLKKRD